MRPSCPNPVTAESSQAASACAGDVALQEERAAVGLEADGEEQRRQVERAVVQVLRVVVDRDRVQVDDAEEGVALVLGRDVLAHRADVVADVFGTRGLDAGENAH